MQTMVQDWKWTRELLVHEPHFGWQGAKYWSKTEYLSASVLLTCRVR